jgi:hypothetical protein
MQKSPVVFHGWGQFDFAHTAEFLKIAAQRRELAADASTIASIRQRMKD